MLSTSGSLTFKMLLFDRIVSLDAYYLLQLKHVESNVGLSQLGRKSNNKLKLNISSSLLFLNYSYLKEFL